MARAPVLAAGGIVLRQSRPPLVAVVRLRKGDWVLPKGKLDDGETPRDAAMREVLEETGQDLSVHEFLGTLAYDLGGRSKIVHYWRMETSGKPTHDLTRDVIAVDWLPLNAAVERLSRDHERAFLANVGPLAVEASRRSRERVSVAPDRTRRRRVAAPKPAPAPVISPDVPQTPDDAVPTIEFAPAFVEQESRDEAFALPIEPEQALAPGTGGDECARNEILVFEEQRFEEQPRSTMMQRLRSWLRRAV
jgi:8-oxo-dGTP diphosphatase